MTDILSQQKPQPSTTVTTPAAEVVGSSAVIGTATDYARGDHTHAMPSSATPSTQAFGDSAAAGSGPTINYSDHKHGMPARTVYGGSTAAATTTTLPAGDIIPITGTTKITGITAGASGRRVTLEIASAGLIITNGSNLKLRGDFMSCAALDTLTLHSDGVNWIEDARAMTPPRCALITNTTQIVSASTITPILFQVETTDNATLHDTGSNTDRITFPIAGLWSYGCYVIWPTGISTGARFITQILLNGTTTMAEYENSQPNAGTFLSQNPSRVAAHVATDYIVVKVYQDSSGSQTLLSASCQFWAIWMGPA